MTERMFPILYSANTLTKDPVSVPWRIFTTSHERRAQLNHDQTLTRLAERGGLALSELAAILDHRPWRTMDINEARAFVKAAVDALPPLEAPPTEAKPKAHVSGRALVMSAFGHPFALAWAAGDHVHQFMDEAGIGHEDQFDFELANIEHAVIADGLWIGELEIIDDGPGDYPGSREHLLQFRNERPATAEEWKAHCSGAWSWDPSEDFSIR